MDSSTRSRSSVVKTIVLAGAAVVLLASSSLKAAMVETPGEFDITIGPDGNGNVVALGSGFVNTDGASSSFATAASAGMTPSTSNIFLGPKNSPHTTGYFFEDQSGSAGFGTGGPKGANSGTGGVFSMGLSGTEMVCCLNTDYVSGTLFSDTAMYRSNTLTGLGLTAGSYSWTAGTGDTANTVNITVTTSTVPEPASLAILAPAGLALMRRRRPAK